MIADLVCHGTTLRTGEEYNFGEWTGRGWLYPKLFTSLQSADAEHIDRELGAAEALRGVRGDQERAGVVAFFEGFHFQVHLFVLAVMVRCF